MKQGWEVKKLGDVCEILDKLRKPITKKNRIAGDYPYYGATGILDYVHDFIFNEKLILIGEDGAKWNSGDRSSFIVAGKYWVNNHAHVVRPDREIILDNWIVYFLNFSDLSKYITGLTVPKLNQGKLKSIEIPVPPLHEQQRIVEILDKAFVAIDKAKQNAEQNLRNAKKVFENYLDAVFENKAFEKIELGEIANFRNGMNFSKSSKGETIKIVGVKDFQNNYWVSIDQLEKVNIDNELQEIDMLKKNDIITVRSNGNPELIGRTLLADKVSGHVSHSGFTIRVRTHSKDIYPQYLCHYLKARKTRTALTKSGKGINIKSLNQVALSKLLIKYPSSLDEQKQIVQQLDNLSAETKKVELIFQQKLDNLEVLKKSILQKAFNGEL